MKCAESGCKKSAMKGSLRCYQHSPEALEARKQLAAKMVAARKQKREARLNAAQKQTSANVPDSRELRTECKRHAWVGGWWEDCPQCSGRVTAPQNPDEITTAQWVEKTRNR
jgi:hypothetical protein